MRRISAVIVACLVLLIAMPSVAFAGKPDTVGVQQAGNKTENIGKKASSISLVDSVLLSSNGANPDKAYLKRDYTPQDPTSRIYSLSSGDDVLIAGSLPMVTPDGEYIDTTWTWDDGSWGGIGADFVVSGNNYFKAEVHGEQVKVWGEDGSRLEWSPILYVGGSKLVRISGPVITDDPVNIYYTDNCVAWAYGGILNGAYVGARRYVRLIQGQLQEFWVFDSDPQGEVRIDHRSSGNYQLEIGHAWDRSGTQISAHVEYIDDEVVPAGAMANAVFPVYVEALAGYYSTVCGLVREYGSYTGESWATLRNGDGYSGGDYCGAGVPWTEVAGWETYPTLNEYHQITRSIFKFDTSSLDEGITITAATFGLRGIYKSAQLGDTPNVGLYKTITSFPDDIIWSDYGEIQTNTISDSYIAFADWSNTGYNGWSLNAAGLAIVSTTGYTTIGVRNQNYDVANVPPTWANGYYDTLIAAYLTPQGSGYQPVLVVTYTPIDPAVTALDASEVSGHNARLNSVVANDGGEPCDIRFGYGTTSQTALNFAAYDTITDWVGSYEVGEHPFLDVSALDLNTTYYYRVQIKNSTSTQTSDDEITFTTSNIPDPPSNIVFHEEPTSISFDWVKGDGATYTVLRYSTVAYPTTISSGLLAANTTNSDYVHEGLGMGTRYYYSFFSGSGGNISTDYAMVMVTTSVGTSPTESEDNLDAPTMPEGYYNDADSTGWPTFIKTGLYDAADSIGMDRDVFSAGLGIGIVAILALILVRVHPMVGTLGGLGLSVFFGTVGIIPMVIAGFMIAAFIVFGGFNAFARGGAQ